MRLPDKGGLPYGRISKNWMLRTRELQRMLLGCVSAALSWDVLFEKRGCDG